MTRLPLCSFSVPSTVVQTAFPSDLPSGMTYALAPDGQRFIVNKMARGSTGQAGYRVVLNWLEELKARLPAGK